VAARERVLFMRVSLSLESVLTIRLTHQITPSMDFLWVSSLQDLMEPALIRPYKPLELMMLILAFLALEAYS